MAAMTLQKNSQFSVFNKSLNKVARMGDMNEGHDQAPINVLAGALAHLAIYMESGCHRSGYLAAKLLESIALSQTADCNLRQHAWQLVEILERDLTFPPALKVGCKLPMYSSACQPLVAKGDESGFATALARISVGQQS